MMPPAKRRKPNPDKIDVNAYPKSNHGYEGSTNLLDVPISPPSRMYNQELEFTAGSHHPIMSQECKGHSATLPAPRANLPFRAVSSPVQLTRVAELAAVENVDTIGIKDLLGDPLIKECWAFNYCFDVDWLLQQFDEDVRDQVRIVLIHGSWRKESPTKIRIEEALRRYKNVKAITAYMPDPFGTHHSKMFILIRHDDSAQIVIFTANLLPQDWRMCQAVWRSPLLPKTSLASSFSSDIAPSFGSGARFQFDLISYLKAYGSKLKDLSEILRSYNFSEVRACLVASTPGRQKLGALDIDRKTLWGWPALCHSIRKIPGLEVDGGFFVAQVSSIATLGASPAWLHGALFRALKGLPDSKNYVSAKPQELSIVFPTADEIRRSIDGYSCGGSIHMKLQSAANQKQLKYLMPHLRHWAGDSQDNSTVDPFLIREAGRRRTGPHIKSYLRFGDAQMTRLDWGMITSANMSKQAWGTDVTGTQDEVKTSSFEIGVLFWPGLWSEQGESTRMVPTFKKDTPDHPTSTSLQSQAWQGVEVGWRMPYDLPLIPYSQDEEPWCATKPHLQPDWRGGIWTG